MAPSITAEHELAGTIITTAMKAANSGRRHRRGRRPSAKPDLVISGLDPSDSPSSSSSSSSSASSSSSSAAEHSHHILALVRSDTIAKVSSTVSMFLSALLAFFTRILADNSSLQRQVLALRQQLRAERRTANILRRKVERHEKGERNAMETVRRMHDELDGERRARAIAEKCHAERLKKMHDDEEKLVGEIIQLQDRLDARDLEISRLRTDQDLLQASLAATTAAAAAATSANKNSDYYIDLYQSALSPTVSMHNLEDEYSFRGTTSPASPDLEGRRREHGRSDDNDEEEEDEEDEDDEDEEDEDEDEDEDNDDEVGGKSASRYDDFLRRARSRVSQCLVEGVTQATLGIELDSLAMTLSAESSQIRAALIFGLSDYFGQKSCWRNFKAMRELLEKYVNLLSQYSESEEDQYEILTLLQSTFQVSEESAANHKNVIMYFYKVDIFDAPAIIDWFHNGIRPEEAGLQDLFSPLNDFVRWLERDDDDDDDEEEEDDDDDDDEDEEEEEEQQEEQEEQEEDAASRPRIAVATASLLAPPPAPHHAQPLSPRAVRFVEPEHQPVPV